MHYPFRVLKCWPQASRSGEDAAAPRFDLRLMTPAAEPFLMLRAELDWEEHDLYSLHFVNVDSGEFHYTNLVASEHSAGFRQCELFGVIELPLDPDHAWNIAISIPNSVHSIPYCLRVNEFGMWQLDPVESSLLVVPPAEVERAPRIGLIGGPAKSGTTWVQRIINSHPDALVTAENSLFGWPAQRRFEQFLVATPPLSFAEGVSHLEPFRSQAILFWRARCESILGQLGTVADVSIALDKTPGNSRHAGMAISSMPGLKFVHCIRNPMDVFVSRFFHERALQARSAELLDVATVDPRIPEHIIHADVENNSGNMFDCEGLLEWLCVDFIAGHLPLQLRDRTPCVHAITYESLHADFEGTVSRLFEFLDLPVTPDLLSRIRAENTFAAYTGRQSGEARPSEFYRKGQVGDHKNYMTVDQIEWVWRRLESELPGIRQLWSAE